MPYPASRHPFPLDPGGSTCLALILVSSCLNGAIVKGPLQGCPDKGKPLDPQSIMGLSDANKNHGRHKQRKRKQETIHYVHSASLTYEGHMKKRRALSILKQVQMLSPDGPDVRAVKIVKLITNIPGTVKIALTEMAREDEPDIPALLNRQCMWEVRGRNYTSCLGKSEQQQCSLLDWESHGCSMSAQSVESHQWIVCFSNYGHQVWTA